MSTDTSGTGAFGLSYEGEDSLFRVLKGVSVAVFVLVGVFPLFWILQGSLTSSTAVNRQLESIGTGAITWFPLGDQFTLTNYLVLFDQQLALSVINTVVVTIGVVLTVVGVSLVAGYGLARFQMPHKENFARVLLLGYLFSPIVLGIPLFIIWRNIGLLNTRLGLILALSAISMPFSVWLMWKYIQTIPEAMEESAWVAGASRWRGFKDVVIPQTQPAIIAAALFAFAIAWNDFTFAEILLRRETLTFAPQVVREIGSQNTTSVEILAMSMTMTVPPLLFAYFMQSYLLKGFQIRSL